MNSKVKCNICSALKHGIQIFKIQKVKYYCPYTLNVNILKLGKTIQA